MKPLRTCLAVLTAVALPLLAAPRAGAEDVDVEALYKKVVKSSVFIITPVKGGFGMGSGSLIDAEKRYVLTNKHVVHDEDTVFVQFPVFLKDGTIMTDKQEYIKRIPTGQAIKGKVLYRDVSRDLSIVQLERLPSGTHALPLAKKSVSVGATTWNIGSPGELKQVFGITEGKVRSVGVEKFLVGGSTPDSVFEVRARIVNTTNPVNPGDSGGPLFDKRGYQVAVTQSKNNRATLVNQFIDIMEVRAWLNEKKIQVKELSDEPDPKAETVGKKDPKKDGGSTLTSGPKDNGTTGPAKKDDTAAAPPEKKDDTAAAPSAADEKAATDKLRLAKLFADGEENRPTFQKKLKDIVGKYPGTSAAKEAQKLLDGLR